jgi:hypothetical protein
MINQQIRKYILFLLFFGSTIFSDAQISNEFRYYYPEFEAQRSHELILHLLNVNFVKNNEYKNRFAWGHTLIGYAIQPSLMYYAGDRLRLRAGIFLQQYSGLGYYSQVRPVLSAHLRLSPSVDVIMGSLQGHIHHRLIEPLFEPERQFTRPLENGIQFLINRPRLWMDVWVDWEQFVQEGDLFPERFTAGVSAKPKLLGATARPWQITLPVNVIAVHRGGEVSSYAQRVQTALNMAFGVKVEHDLNGILQKAGVFGYVMNYRNLNEVGQLEVNNGKASYIGAIADTRRINMMLGYYRGHNFVALRGSGMFQSVSPIRENVYVPYRHLITSKISYNRAFLEKIRFSFLFGGYYDVRDHRFDFASGVHINFNPSFFITKVKFF